MLTEAQKSQVTWRLFVTGILITGLYLVWWLLGGGLVDVFAERDSAHQPKPVLLSRLLTGQWRTTGDRSWFAPEFEGSDELETAVVELSGEFPGRFSVVVYDMQSKTAWAVNPHAVYHPASTAKLAVALYALERVRAGRLRWDETISYKTADFESPGGGFLEAANKGDRYTVATLVDQALRHSNNIAINMLARRLGWYAINNWTQGLGGQSRLSAKVKSATPVAVLSWWVQIEKRSKSDPVNSAYLMKPLSEVAYDNRIRAGLPPDVPAMLKHGTVAGVFHDSGWIVGAKRPYIVVVMTSGVDEGTADAWIGQVSEVVYRVMNTAKRN